MVVFHEPIREVRMEIEIGAVFVAEIIVGFGKIESGIKAAAQASAHDPIDRSGETVSVDRTAG